MAPRTIFHAAIPRDAETIQVKLMAPDEPLTNTKKHYASNILWNSIQCLFDRMRPQPAARRPVIPIKEDIFLFRSLALPGNVCVPLQSASPMVVCIHIEEHQIQGGVKSTPSLPRLWVGVLLTDSEPVKEALWFSYSDSFQLNQLRLWEWEGVLFK